MGVVPFPPQDHRSRDIAESLAYRLLEKVEAGEPGAEKLLRRMVEMNPEFWRRLAEPKGQVVEMRGRR
jgi:hypothetical protein